MRKILECSGNEVSGEGRNLCKEALLGLYSSKNVIRKIDKECVVGGVCSTSGGDNVQIWCVNVKKRDSLVELHVNRYYRNMVKGFSWLRIGTGFGLL
jgi:hypothetical protein